MSQRIFSRAAFACASAFGWLVIGAAFAQAPAVGPNVNMVQGTKWPQGDPFLTKQNEPSIAVSSRNARHLLAGSNDYRLVPVEIAEELDDPEAWVQVYKSLDGGETWYSTPLGGCPLNIPECTDSTGLTAPLRALHPNFGADPTVRPGPYGTFFLSSIAGTRDTNSNGVVTVQRFVDKNNDVQRGTDVRGVDGQGRPFVRPAQDPILPDSMYIVTTGTPGQGKDKPWVVADLPGRRWASRRNCTLLGWTRGRQDVSDVSESVPAFNVYVSFANFTGQGQNQKPQMFVSVSMDCGQTFGNPIKISAGTQANQGSNSAIDPLTGTVYIVWRNFDNPSSIQLSKSTDGGASWSNQPIRVATFNAYDQGSTNVSMRTLGFPTIAVSVGADGRSRVHVAWTQRKVAPSASPPYACPGANADDCDARIVMKTSLDGGNTWPATATPVSVIPAGNDPFNPTVGRGNQIQPAMTFAAGKLLITWLDQRLDSTEGKLQCPDGTITNCQVSQMVEVRERRGNLDPACTFPAGVAQVGGTSCYLKDTVFTPYISDGTKYLVRRHTLDVFTATALPTDVPSFTTSRASQYTFGTSVQGTIGQDGKLTPVPGTYAIRQKQVNPVNLPLFSNGTGAFLGDYIDAAGPIIVATGDPNAPYKFNVGGNANTQFTTGGRASTFHLAFTDNRDVIPPFDGNWVTPTCNTSAFTTDGAGNITGVSNANSCNGSGKPGPGFSGNRNQNVYTAIASDHSLAFANFNSKLLNAQTFRRFVVTIQNLSNIARTYTLDSANQASGATAVFDETSLATTATITVQPGSTATRVVSAKSGNPKAQVAVKVTTSSDLSWTTQVLLNADPTGVFVTNGDGTNSDVANDNLGNVVLSNAVLTNNALSNNVLSNAVLSNNALTNAVLSNVVLSNNVLSNLTDPNNALSNAVLSNVVLSNVVLTNQTLGNVVLSNTVLDNVVLTNNTLNAALSNLDPTNVALSNVVLSNNALTNVVLSNSDPNNALSNAVLSNVALSNAVLSNVVLSNAALSNNVLSNNVLSNVVLSNATISDQQAAAQSTGNPDADPLRAIETGSPELTANAFTTSDLAESSADNLGFKDTTFTVRNHGNTDTMLSVKMLLRDAVGCTGAPPYNSCQPPSTFKLQVILRKVAFGPAAIPPTNPAISSGQTYRLGLLQRNAEVSNVGTLALIDPADPNFGKFQPLDPNAATLPLAAGEWAYVTIRAIGVNGTTPPDPADLLQWGAKAVSSNATTTTGPLIITTQSFPNTPRLFVALQQATQAVKTFGGTTTPQTPITGTVQCTDPAGNPVLISTSAPTASDGSVGNWWINTSTSTVYGPKDLVNGWASSQPLIQPTGDPLNPVHAILPCPLPPTAVSLQNGGTFSTNASTQVSTDNLQFTPKFWGDFYTRLAVFDSTSGSPPQPKDQQVIKVHVDAAIPNLVLNTPAQLVYNSPSLDLAPLATSDSPVAITFSTGTSPSCAIAGDGHTLNIVQASPYSPQVSDCVVTATQLGNETYAFKSVQKAIFIDRATQTLVYTSVPLDNQLTYNTGGLPSSVAAMATSTSAPNSGLAVTFSSQTGSTCSVNANTGALTINGAGTCTIAADQGGNNNYKPAPTLPTSFLIAKANQNLVFGAAPTPTFGDPPVTISATTSSPTAPASLNPAIVFGTTTPGICSPGVSSMPTATATVPVTILAAGNCTITADQAGNANYNAAAQQTLTFNILKAPTTITAAAQFFTSFGSSSVLSGKVNRGAGFTSVFPPGPVSIVVQKGANPPAATFNPTTSGPDGVFSATDGPPPTIPSDSYTVTFGYAGDSNFQAATPVTATLRVEGFSATSNMSTTRAGHTATLLGDGTTLANVLVVGGVNASNTPLGSAEIYCAVVSAPCTASDLGTFISAGASLAVPRFGHTATRLADGNVLIAGGATSNSPFTPTGLADVYCVSMSGPICTQLSDIGSFKSVSSGMTSARTAHTATLLNDGNVLLTGGFFDNTLVPTSSTEIFCVSAVGPVCPPNAGTFKAATSMGTPRDSHTATLLQDGTVLIAGGATDGSGTGTNTAQLYCSAVSVNGPCAAADGSFQPAGNTMSIDRQIHTATLLKDGRVVVAGGDDTAGPTTLSSADIYCAVGAGNCTAPTDLTKFKPAANTMTSPHVFHASSLLNDGRMIVLGGRAGPTSAPIASTDLFAPITSAFASAPLPTMTAARAGFAATLLGDGRVLVTGGRSTGNTPTNSAEIYNGPF